MSPSLVERTKHLLKLSVNGPANKLQFKNSNMTSVMGVIFNIHKFSITSQRLSNILTKVLSITSKLKSDQTSDTCFLTFQTSVNFVEYILRLTKSFLKYNELLRTQLKELN